jgi:hypothetical protein
MAERHDRSRAVIAGVLLVLMAAGTAGCLAGLVMNEVVYPGITPVSGVPPIADSVYVFPFQDGTVSIAAPVDSAVLAGARQAEKSAHIYGDLALEEWLPGYYLSFISDPDLLPLYDTLGEQFDAVRKAKSLDSDAYLELICTFVQSIPYETDAMLVAPKFAIETIADGEGDCDDKSLLLAALLAREGYAVALLYFEPEQHMAVGVTAPGYRYGDSGYAYIEATNVSFIGIPPDELAGGIILTSEPFVIPVGSGTLGYGRCDETLAIDEARTRAKAAIAAHEVDVAAMDAAIDGSFADLRALAARMEALRRAGRTEEYNALVPVYNSKAAAYNQDFDAIQPSIDSYNHQVGIYNYITTHVHDRPGTYAWLMSTGA